jgi:hypothetical protein
MTKECLGKSDSYFISGGERASNFKMVRSSGLRFGGLQGDWFHYLGF